MIQIKSLSRAEQSRAEQSRAEQSRAEQSRAEQLDCCLRLGNAYNDEKFNGGNFGGNVWDKNGIAPTMKTGASASQQCSVEIKKMKNKQCVIVGDWFGILETEKEEIIGIDEQNKCIREDTFGCLSTDGSSPKHNNRVGEIKKIKIRQATKDGFVECEIPGIADLNYESSTTRRGRCIDGGRISPTLTTENTPSVIEFGNPDFYNFLYEIDDEIYLIRIRKLTPKECWSLMDFNDGSYERAEKVNSNTQLYKEAGNSIVVNCLVAIFGQMIEGKEDLYKNI